MLLGNQLGSAAAITGDERYSQMRGFVDGQSGVFNQRGHHRQAAFTKEIVESFGLAIVVNDFPLHTPG